MKTFLAVVILMTEFVGTIHGCEDPNIIWDEEPIVVFMANPDSFGYAWMEWGSGDPWATYATYWGPTFTRYAYERTLENAVTDRGQYYIKGDLVQTVNGDASHLTNLNGSYTYGTWMDYFGDEFEEYEEFSFYDSVQNGVPDVVVVDITVAPGNGAGGVREACGKTKRVTYIREGDSGGFTIDDEVSVSSGADLDGVAASEVHPVGETWTQVSGEIKGYFSDARVYGIPALYVYESNVANATGTIQMVVQGDCSLIGRYVDASNYWEARIRTNGGSDPTFELNKIVNGKITTVDYIDLVGYGDMQGDRTDVRLTFWGSTIEAEIAEAWVTTQAGWPDEIGPIKVVADDSTHSTATKWGFYSTGINSELERFAIYVSDAELRNTYLSGSYANVPALFGDKVIAPIRSKDPRVEWFVTAADFTLTGNTVTLTYNSGSSLTNNLVSWWTFDEGSSIDRVDSHGSNDLAVSGVNPVNDQTGIVSNAVDTTLIDSNTHCKNESQTGIPSGANDWAIAGWVQPKSISGGIRYTACCLSKVSVNLESHSDKSWRLIYNNQSFSEDQFAIIIYCGSSRFICDADTFGAATEDEWYFVYAYHDASANEIGISVNNGTIDTTTYTGTPNSEDAAFNIGKIPSSIPYSGDFWLDELAIWDRVLDADEVTALYNDGYGIGYGDL